MQAGGHRFEPVQLHGLQVRGSQVRGSEAGSDGLRRGGEDEGKRFAMRKRNPAWWFRASGIWILDMVERRARGCLVRCGCGRVSCDIRLPASAIRGEAFACFLVFMEGARGRGGEQRCASAPAHGALFYESVEIKREKGVWWMPWRREAKKDVAGCEKFRGVASRL